MLKKIIAWLVAVAAWPCFAAPLASGDYSGLLIGVDKRGALTGYFAGYRGEGQFSCIFFVSGKVGGPAAKVDTWFPEDRKPGEVIGGVIDSLMSGGMPAIRLTLQEEHGGCLNVQRFASEVSAFQMTEPGSWEAIRIVAAPKAYFYDRPSSPRPRQAYAVTGDPLLVFETRDGWVRAEYRSPENRRTSGWVQERDLFSASSPKAQR